jgi:hypothetical protein
LQDERDCLFGFGLLCVVCPHRPNPRREIRKSCYRRSPWTEATVPPGVELDQDQRPASLSPYPEQSKEEDVS